VPVLDVAQIWSWLCVSEAGPGVTHICEKEEGQRIRAAGDLLSLPKRGVAKDHVAEDVAVVILLLG
jgi:hypothetical protein